MFIIKYVKLKVQFCYSAFTEYYLNIVSDCCMTTLRVYLYQLCLFFNFYLFLSSIEIFKLISSAVHTNLKFLEFYAK